MDTSGTRPQNTKLSTLEHIIVSTDSMESVTAPRGAIEHQKASGIAYSFNFLWIPSHTWWHLGICGQVHTVVSWLLYLLAYGTHIISLVLTWQRAMTVVVHGLCQWVIWATTWGEALAEIMSYYHIQIRSWLCKLVSPAELALAKKSTPGLFFRCRSPLDLSVVEVATLATRRVDDEQSGYGKVLEIQLEQHLNGLSRSTN